MNGREELGRAVAAATDIYQLDDPDLEVLAKTVFAYCDAVDAVRGGQEHEPSYVHAVRVLRIFEALTWQPPEPLDDPAGG